MEVEVRDSFEYALDVFTKKVRSSGILSESSRRGRFETNRERARRKQQAERKRKRRVEQQNLKMEVKRKW